MYKKAYGLIQTLAPLHIGATAGEEAGNLNLIFRDPFLQTGIIPGSSLRGRLRADLRSNSDNRDSERHWYGDEGKSIERPEAETTESRVKFEFASIVWLPVFCPGQPVVWVSCPRLLKRYQRISGQRELDVDWDQMLYKRSPSLKPLKVNGQEKLFFNFGLLDIEGVMKDPDPWFPLGKLPAVIVADDEIGMIHDMALFRQSRVRLEDDQKRVQGGGFFNTEALPVDTQMIFAVALRDDGSEESWRPFGKNETGEVFLGGLESIGFGLCEVKIQEI